MGALRNNANTGPYLDVTPSGGERKCDSADARVIAAYAECAAIARAEGNEAIARMTAPQAKAILAYIASLEENANWESIQLMMREKGFSTDEVGAALDALHVMAGEAMRPEPASANEPILGKSYEQEQAEGSPYPIIGVGHHAEDD